MKNRNKLIDFQNFEYAFNTSETYSKNVYLSKKSLLIPYLNVQISDENPFDIKVGHKIDFSYILLSGVSNIQWNGGVYNGKNIIGELKIDSQIEEKSKDYFGFNRKNDGYEIKVCFQKIEVLIPSNSRVSENEWIPWDTPNYPRNLNSEKLNDFFEANILPLSIIENFERKESIVLEFNNSKKEEIELIKDKW